MAGGQRPAGPAALLSPDRGGGDGDLPGRGGGVVPARNAGDPCGRAGAEAKTAGFRAFTRYACKMATGTGKTTVMGMLAAWSILNRVAESTDERFSDTVLVV